MAGLKAGVTALQTGAEKRGWKLLIPKERFVGVPPPRVFSEKRLQVIENKGRRAKREDKEAAVD